jgi:hypothetical protein
MEHLLGGIIAPIISAAEGADPVVATDLHITNYHDCLELYRFDNLYTHDLFNSAEQLTIT